MLTPHGPHMSEWSKRASAVLARRGWTQAELARRSGQDQHRLNKWFQGRVDNPRGDALARIAAALGVNLPWLQYGKGPAISSLPLIGYVSAGEAWIPTQEHDNGHGLDEVEFAIPDHDDPIAIEVRGNSMSPAYRPGDKVICSRRRDGEMSSAIGRDCVVLTRNGEGYLKRLIRGSTPGCYTLRSYNPDFPDQVDIELEWAAPVLWIKRG